MSRRMGERHEHLARPRTRQPDIVFYDRIAASVAVFEPQPFENPLRRMPLLRWRRLICLEDRIDDWNERSKLRQVPCCARSRAALNSDTSWRSSPGSIRKPVPPPAGSSLQQKQTVEPLRKSPLQTSPAALPNQGSKRVSPESGRVLLRHAAAKCRRSVAYYCSAAYTFAWTKSQVKSASKHVSRTNDSGY
jgi:hypothetical protein